MASKRVVSSDKPRRAPATSAEAREKQLIGLAYDEVERKIRAGEATSQELTHFLKLGSHRARLEERQIELNSMLAEKKIASIESAQRVEELYEQALSAMRSYSGQEQDRAFDD